MTAITAALAHPSARLIMAECAAEGLGVPETAYVLSTAWHESARFNDMREIWGPTPAQKRYEGRKDLGNTTTGDGKKFMGRGYSMITGRRNYLDWSDRLKLDLWAHPELAERPDIAAKILVVGMRLGTFTGKKLADYITPKKTDYVGSRRIINGKDCAALIAGYATEFEAAIRAAKDPAPVQIRTLRLGDKGDDVTALQRKLKLAGFYRTTVDGDFGPATEAAVKAFQRSAGLKADGVVGDRTRTALANL